MTTRYVLAPAFFLACTLAAGAASAETFHYVPSVSSVTWAHGCGRPSPDGQPCPRGLVITYTPSYADLKLKLDTKLDGSRLLVHIDTYSQSKIHPMVLTHPVTTEIANAPAVRVGHRYTVHVRDYDNKKLLWSGMVTPTPPVP